MSVFNSFVLFSKWSGEKIYRFLSEAGNSASVFFHSVALLSLFYTINGDAVQQDETGFLAPYTSLSMAIKDDEEKLGDMVDIRNQKDLPVYIFVFDTSKSIAITDDDEGWRKSIEKSVNGQLARPYYFNMDSMEVGGDYLCRLKVSELLLSLSDRPLNFAVWSVGDEAHIVYPESGSYASSKKDNIYQAIDAIKGTIKEREEADDDTDFLQLLNKISNEYESEGNFVDLYQQPSHVFIFVSDLVHDRKNAIRREAGGDVEVMVKISKRDRRDLEDRVSRFAMSNVLSNMVVFHGGYGVENDNFTVPLREIFREKFGQHRFKDFSLARGADDILYANIIARNPIKFFYTNPHEKIERTFTIRLGESGKYRIGLIYPSSLLDRGHPAKNFSFGFNALQQGGRIKDGGGYRGSLSTRGGYYDVPGMQKDEKIQMVYAGPLPEIELPVLHLYAFPDSSLNSPSHLRSFSIPIIFVKRLPFLTAIFMIFLQVLALFSVVMLGAVLWKDYQGERDRKLVSQV